MNRFKVLLVATALLTGGSALASAQPSDRDGRGYDRDHYQERDRDNQRRLDPDDYRFRDRDDHRYFRDRDDRRFDHDRRFDRDDYFVGERRFFNGFYWTWDGSRWCRRDGRALFYFSF